MRASNQEHLQRALIPALEAGTLTRAEVDSLFMLLRERASRGSLVRDIGDSVAHDERDRSYIHEYADRFVSHFLRVLTLGGSLHSQTLYPIDDVIGEVCALASTLGARIDHSEVIKQRRPIAHAIGEALDGVQVRVRSSYHMKVVLSDFPLSVLMIPQRDRPYGGIQLFSGVGIGMPLLLHDDRRGVLTPEMTEPVGNARRKAASFFQHDPGAAQLTSPNRVSGA